MSDFKFWRWDKKPRTMLRFIKPGDIFCFRLDDEKYCFGRVISKIMSGHVAEFFDFISSSPEINEKEIITAKRIIDLVVIDTYSLFDKKIENGSDWRIIGRQENYTPKDIDGVYFTYGLGNSCKKVDIFDNESAISEDESKKYPRLSPHGDFDIKRLIIK
ncbi:MULTISPECIES: immunity 26/phosphotriesterase HocA family protein [Yersinia pseudotuberculosis complex]|uniref:immunity 26/phosphotriesterase HocA family protein n=1 Tax=Yersinia pseudotuberculosis complex TaxID=1649845 RepID=UPI00042848DE|nr:MULTISPECIES: immunity 26/phosphotriesterase HocA family protein [Yersinia pseudotuberculosis complex]CNF74725.1 putative cytoplasmic protein [Yersinia similis]